MTTGSQRPAEAQPSRLILPEPSYTSKRNIRRQCQYIFTDGRQCDRTRYQAHMCKAHFDRKQDGRDMDAPVRLHGANKGHPCSVPGCCAKAKARQLCQSHYELWRRGDPNPRRLLKYVRRKPGTVSKVGSLSIRTAIYQHIRQLAVHRGVTIHFIVNEVLEDWYRKNREEDRPLQDRTEHRAWAQPAAYEAF